MFCSCSKHQPHFKTLNSMWCRYYLLPGSGTMNVTLLPTKSNMMLPGQWMFKIGWPGMGPLNVESANSFTRNESVRRHHFILDQREYEVWWDCSITKKIVELRHSGRMGAELATWVDTFAPCLTTSMKKDACKGQVSVQKSDFRYTSLSAWMAFSSNVHVAHSAFMWPKYLERNLESGSLWVTLRTSLNPFFHEKYHF